MPINPLKEFFQRKKAEIKFARAGRGQTLSQQQSEQPSSSANQSARQAAAEAAMKRFNKDDTKPAQRPRLTNTLQESKASPKNETEPKETERPQKVVQKELPIIDGIAQRDIQIFTKEELALRAKQPDIDDDFFRLTVEDAKLFQQRYNEERARNEILKTSEMRKREAEAKRPTTNVARLRFRLPNEMVIEGSFSGSETLDIVRDWLFSFCLGELNLELDNVDILLGLRPFKKEDFSKSVKQLGLIPATTLTVVKKGNQ